MTVFLVGLCVVINLLNYDIYIKENWPKEKGGLLCFVLVTVVITSVTILIKQTIDFE